APWRRNGLRESASEGVGTSGIGVPGERVVRSRATGGPAASHRAVGCSAGDRAWPPADAGPLDRSLTRVREPRVLHRERLALVKRARVDHLANEERVVARGDLLDDPALHVPER